VEELRNERALKVQHRDEITGILTRMAEFGRCSARYSTKIAVGSGNAATVLAFAQKGGRTVVAARREPYSGYESKVCDTILVAEDEVLVRMVIADNLRSAGYTVVEASNAHEALELLRNSVDVRLILSDVRMPGTIDGVALAARFDLNFRRSKSC
jgi:PleD family two-component response regulator